MWVRLRGIQAELATSKGETVQARRDADANATGLQLSEAARKDDSARLEDVVRRLHAEIEILEKDVAACADPAAVRDRLRRLLGGPTVP
jgi:hypothetical protein